MSPISSVDRGTVRTLPCSSLIAMLASATTISSGALFRLLASSAMFSPVCASRAFKRAIRPLLSSNSLTSLPSLFVGDGHTGSLQFCWDLGWGASISPSL